MKKLFKLGFAVALLAAIMAIGLASCKNNSSDDDSHTHTWNAGEVTKEATCAEDGEKTYTCAVCGATKTEQIPAAGHAWGDWVAVTAATTTTPGSKKKTCSVCKKEITEEIPIIPEDHVHTYSGDWKKDENSHWHECECGAKSDEEAHSYGDGEVTTQPTCTTVGVMTSTCKCGKQQTEEIAATGHSWNEGEVTTQPTTRAKGVKTYTCTKCNETYTEDIDKKTFPTSAPSLDTLGAKKQLTDAELETYGISATSVPAKIAGATYYTFGVYPQTIKADGVDVDETIINLEFEEVDYYLGSDDNWYAKCTENAYTTGYKYSDGNPVAQASANSYKYFKVGPIVWRKLGDSGYLLAEKELTANVAYYGSSSDRTLGSTTIYPNNYKYSNIRAWLNGIQNQFVIDGGTSDSYTIDWSNKGFLQTAFTQSQRDKIATTEVDNSVESMKYQGQGDISDTYKCDNTNDKIFLLSELEATTLGNGFAASRIRLTTDYAKANYAYQSTTTGLGGYWWLRSPHYYYSDSARRVGDDGDAADFNYVDYKYHGVVPALKLVEN